MLYSGKFLRTINFTAFEDFTAALKINFLKSFYSIECYDSLVDSQNLICEIYHGKMTLKIFCQNYSLCS